MSEHIAFRDCGENFDAVACPRCCADAMAWWSEWMDADFDGEGFALDRRVAPCCGAELTLDELAYDMPQGFSRFEALVVNANEPGVSGEVAQAIAAAVGGSMRTLTRRV